MNCLGILNGRLPSSRMLMLVMVLFSSTWSFGNEDSDYIDGVISKLLEGEISHISAGLALKEQDCALVVASVQQRLLGVEPAESRLLKNFGYLLLKEVDAERIAEGRNLLRKGLRDADVGTLSAEALIDAPADELEKLVPLVYELIHTNLGVAPEFTVALLRISERVASTSVDSPSVHESLVKELFLNERVDGRIRVFCARSLVKMDSNKCLETFQEADSRGKRYGVMALVTAQPHLLENTQTLTKFGMNLRGFLLECVESNDKELQDYAVKNCYYLFFSTLAMDSRMNRVESVQSSKLRLEEFLSSHTPVVDSVRETGGLDAWIKGVNQELALPERK